MWKLWLGGSVTAPLSVPSVCVCWCVAKKKSYRTVFLFSSIFLSHGRSAAVTVVTSIQVYFFSPGTKVCLNVKPIYNTTLLPLCLVNKAVNIMLF